MPGFSVNKNDFLDRIGKKYSDEEINDLLFDFGLELDEIYEENNSTHYKLDIPANRYDLLCIEGLSNAILRYLGKSVVEPAVEDATIEVVQEETHEREHIACGVIRNVNVDYDSFIVYQDKLHSTIGRMRGAVSIGTHDLDKIGKHKIVYKSVERSKINFIPLNGNKEINGRELKTHLGIHLHRYVDLMKEEDKCVVFESNGEILSLPPVINSEFSKIDKNTKNIFIEVTGTDFVRVNQVLKLIMLNFNSGVIEQVRIIKNDKISVTPEINKHQYVFTLDEMCKKSGLDLSIDKVTSGLQNMMHTVICKDNKITVIPDMIRMDIIDKADIIEDLLIEFGFNNINRKNAVQVHSIGKENNLNKFSDKISEEMALLGFNETLTLTLLNTQCNIMHDKMVKVKHAKSKEYEVVRTSLLPGIWKSVASNCTVKLPIKLFEVADIVLMKENKAVNRRMLTGLYAGNSSKLEEMLGTICFLFKKLKVEIKFGDNLCNKAQFDLNESFLLEKWSDHFIANQTAPIFINNIHVGFVGVAAPSVNELFKIPLPMSCFEIDLEMVFDLIFDMI